MWETHSQEFYDSEDDLDERVSFAFLLAMSGDLQ